MNQENINKEANKFFPKRQVQSIFRFHPWRALLIHVMVHVLFKREHTLEKLCLISMTQVKYL